MFYVLCFMFYVLCLYKFPRDFKNYFQKIFIKTRRILLFCGCLIFWNHDYAVDS